MHKLAYLLLALGLMLPGLSQAQSEPDRIIGMWQTTDDETGEAKSVVRIYKDSNGKYHGRIERLLNRQPGDENPDCKNCSGKNAKYRARDNKVIGIVFVRDLEYNPDRKRWEKGSIFDPAKGSEYRCEVWLEKGILKVKGMHWTGLSRTQDWKRTQN